MRRSVCRVEDGLNDLTAVTSGGAFEYSTNFWVGYVLHTDA